MDDCPHGLDATWCSICLGKVPVLERSYRKPRPPMPMWLLKKLGLLDDKKKAGPVMAARVPAARHPHPSVYRRY